MDNKKGKQSKLNENSKAKENEKEHRKTRKNENEEVSPRKRYRPTFKEIILNASSLSDEDEDEDFLNKNKKSCEINVVKIVDQLQRGYFKSSALNEIADRTHTRMLRNFKVITSIDTPDKRVSALQWHPENSKLLAIGGRTGTLLVYNHNTGSQFRTHSNCENIEDCIHSIKFDTKRNGEVYTISSDFLSLYNFETGKASKPVICAPSDRACLCSMDIHQDGKSMYIGDSKGGLFVYHLDSCETSWRTSRVKLHNSKIRHVEFNNRDPNLMVTASLDKTVKLWDIRKLDDFIVNLEHDCAVSSAKFSRTNGCRLLTTDMHDQLRIYKAPTWISEQVIRHPHRFIPALTYFKASWYPLADLFLVGRFPDPDDAESDFRSIDVFSVQSGRLCHQMTDLRCLVSLCDFNCSGQILATSAARNGAVILWRFK